MSRNQGMIDATLQAARAASLPSVRGVNQQDTQRAIEGSDLQQAAGAFRAIGTPRAVAFADSIQSMPIESLGSLARAGIGLEDLYGSMMEETALSQQAALAALRYGSQRDEVKSGDEILTVDADGNVISRAPRWNPEASGGMAYFEDPVTKRKYFGPASGISEFMDQQDVAGSGAARFPRIINAIGAPGSQAGTRADIGHYLGRIAGVLSSSLQGPVTAALTGGATPDQIQATRTDLVSAATQLRQELIAEFGNRGLSNQERQMLLEISGLQNRIATESDVRSAAANLWALELAREARRSRREGTSSPFYIETEDDAVALGKYLREHYGVQDPSVRNAIVYHLSSPETFR